MAPSASKPIQTQNLARIQAKDFVVVSFELAVFPSEVSVYETYNPGSVVRIWACPYAANISQDIRWRLLYEGEPHSTEKQSRIFSPPLRNIPFPTRTLRLDLDHRHLDYHCQLDAIQLTGFQPGMFGVLATLKLTDLARVKPGSPDPVPTELPTNPQLCLLSLPQELVHCVLVHLDLVSLSRLACTCRRLQTLAYDWSLYARLDLNEQWHCGNAALTALEPRCQRITALRLRGIIGLSVDQFLSCRGEMLTHLTLDSCQLKVTPAQLLLGGLCPNLQELGLRNVAAEDGCLRGLKKLRRLDLYRSNIGQNQLLAVLNLNPDLDHLNVGSCEGVTNMDSVALCLANKSVNLISLDAWKSRGWTSAGLSSLSRLSKLQELDLGWSLADEVGGLLPLVESCSSLKKLGLAACRGTNDADLLQLVQSASSLQQLDLTGIKGLSEHILERVLSALPSLCLLDLSFCGFQQSQLSRWQQAYPRLQIK